MALVRPRRRLAAFLLLISLAAASCSSASGAKGGGQGPRATSTTAAVPPPTVAAPVGPPKTRYEAAVDAAARRGLQVWLEVDLVKRWQQGAAAFDDGVSGLAELGRRPGVVGFKIADELGYRDGVQSANQVRQFLDDSAKALRRAAPGKLILADVLVPELGCGVTLGNQPAADQETCVSKARLRYPALTPESVDGYFASHDLDAVDLSTGILDDAVYKSWGTTRDAVEADAWREVRRRGWLRDLRVNGRKALAHAGAYEGRAGQAESDLQTFVDLPLRYGAGAVDIWTWRQVYRGDTVQLVDPGLLPNALFDGIRSRHERGADLLTHFSPSFVDRSVDADLDVLAQGFTGVFIAAGLG
jgi:hypothetical protein